MALPALPPDHQPSMATHFFDTHAYVKKLKAAGVPEIQAEAHVETLVEIVENGLATKIDIHNLRKEIKETKKELKDDIKEVRKEIDAIKKELKNDIKEVRNEINEARNEINEVRNEINDVKNGLTQLKSEMDQKFETQTYKLTVRLGAMIAAGIVLISVLSKIL